MEETSLAASTLLAELTDAYDRCNLTVGNLAALLSHRLAVTPKDESLAVEWAEPNPDLELEWTADPSAPSAPTAAIPSAAPLFCACPSAERRQLLNVARCDFPLITPKSGLRLAGDADQPLSPAPGVMTGGTRRNSSSQPVFEAFRRTSTDLTPSRRMSWASAAQVSQPTSTPSPPQPLLLRGRSLQRYDSNPGVAEEELPLSPLGQEGLDGSPRFGAMSPRGFTTGGGGGLGGSSGNNGGAGGNLGSPFSSTTRGSGSIRFMRSQSSALPSSSPPLAPSVVKEGGVTAAGAAPRSPAAGNGGGGGGGSGSGTPLVPTPPPLASRGSISARNLLFFKMRRPLVTPDTGGSTGGGGVGGGGSGTAASSPLCPGGERRTSRSMSTSGVMGASRSAAGAQLLQQQQPTSLPQLLVEEQQHQQQQEQHSPGLVTQDAAPLSAPGMLPPTWPANSSSSRIGVGGGGSGGAAVPVRRSLQGLPPRRSFSSSRYSISEYGTSPAN